MKTKQITESLYCFTGSDVVNVYLFVNKKLLIDTGNPVDRGALRSAIEQILPCAEIAHVILTHFHYDHTGNLSLFPRACVYASSEEIAALAQFGLTLTFNKEVLKELQHLELRPVQDYTSRDRDFECVLTPGHTPGSLSLKYADPNTKKQYLFSGDLLFKKGVGRTDLPSSDPEKMQSSLSRISQLTFDVLLPGHNYS